MKKSKPQHFLIDLVIYPAKVIVSIDEDDKTLMRYLKKFGNTEEECKNILKMEEFELGICHAIPSNHILIRLMTREDYPISPASVAHEALHATIRIMDGVGIELEIQTSEEAYCYVLMYLVNEIYKKLK